MTDEKVPALSRRARMFDHFKELEELPDFEADFRQDETVPTGDAWDMFHSYVEIGAIQTLDLGALLMSAVTFRHAFEYLQHDLEFMDLARVGGFVDNADPPRPKVEDWLRTECQSRLGTEVVWFEQLQEIANFTKHVELDLKTSIFGDHPPLKVNRAGTMTRREEPRTYQSLWEMKHLPSTITRTTLTMTADGKMPVAIDVEETLYQTGMFFYDMMRAHRPDRLEARPLELVNEGE